MISGVTMAPKDVNFSGKWLMQKEENMEAYLEALGVNFLLRKVVLFVKQTHTIEQDGDKIKITIATSPITDEVEEFTVGEQYDHDMKVMGGLSKCTAKWDGKKLVTAIEPQDKSTPAQTTIREITEDEMIFTYVCGETEGKRYFKKE